MIERLWIYLLFPGLPFLLLYIAHRRDTKKRSHLKRPFYNFRRPPGYGLQKKVDEQWEFISETIMLFVLSATMPAMAYSLGGTFWLAAIVGAFLCIVTLRRLLKGWSLYRASKLGLLGEQIAGAELDALQSREIHVYHDLNFTRDGHSWNIDHILLTRQGVLVIETKSPRRRCADGKFPDELTYNGKRILFPGGGYDTSAIRQVKRNVSDIKDAICRWTGGDVVPVFPVLVYPGWKVKRTARGGVSVVGHDKIGQLLPLGGETIEPKLFKILKVNFDRESREDLDEPNQLVTESSRHSSSRKRTPVEPSVRERATSNA